MPASFSPDMLTGTRLDTHLVLIRVLLQNLTGAEPCVLQDAVCGIIYPQWIDITLVQHPSSDNVAVWGGENCKVDTLCTA
jgi:hypothetical protein